MRRFYKETPKYVQDGLVLWLDGEYNVGLNASHNYDADVWHDLSGHEQHATINNKEEVRGWMNNGFDFNFASDKTSFMIPASNINAIPIGNSVYTIEVVVKNPIVVRDNVFFSICNGSASKQSNFILCYIRNSSTTDINNAHMAYDTLISYPTTDKIVQFQYTYNQQYVKGYYLGELKKEDAKSGINVVKKNAYIGTNLEYTNYDCKGILYCFRIYNRVLSAEELQFNWEEDKRRFKI